MGMTRPDNVYKLPSGLPVPEDDGACAHLTGMKMPAVSLRATDGSAVNLSSLPSWTVLYCYPRTGRPDEPSPTGWDDIPGARGCTPQSCSYRDHYQEMRDLGIDAIFGLSTQGTPYQQEAAARLNLPFQLLSDDQLEFARALTLPTFEVDGMTLIKRLTLIVHDNVIEQVFYPVFPPDLNAPTVIHWLVERTTGQHL
jgi:peroxiredoxin